jgi:hypothetical protein
MSLKGSGTKYRVPVEVRTKHWPNRNLDRYGYTSYLGVVYSIPNINN